MDNIIKGQEFGVGDGIVIQHEVSGREEQNRETAELKSHSRHTEEVG